MSYLSSYTSMKSLKRRTKRWRLRVGSHGIFAFIQATWKRGESRFFKHTCLVDQVITNRYATDMLSMVKVQWGAMLATTAWMKWREPHGYACYAHTSLITGLWATHAWSVAYQLPGANRNQLEFGCFLKVILLVSHHNPYPDFLFQTKSPHMERFFIFQNKTFWMSWKMLWLPLRPQCLCMRQQYDILTYSKHNFMASIIL